MDELRSLFPGPVGYSDHTADHAAVLYAVARGAQIIEKHITILRDVPNAQDWKVSAGPEDFGALVSAIHRVTTMLGSGKKEPAACESATREDYLARLAHVQDVTPLSKEQVLRARQHAYTLFARRSWKMRSFRAEFTEDLKATKASGDPLVHNLRPVAPTVADLRTRGDLAKWAQWAEQSTAPDYVDAED